MSSPLSNEVIPDRRSSRKQSLTRTSLDGQRAEQLRSSPLRGQPDGARSPPSPSAASNQFQNGRAPYQAPASPTRLSSGQVVGSKTRRSTDLAPHDPSPLVPRYSDTLSNTPTPSAINNLASPSASSRIQTNQSSHGQEIPRLSQGNYGHTNGHTTTGGIPFVRDASQEQALRQQRTPTQSNGSGRSVAPVPPSPSSSAGFRDNTNQSQSTEGGVGNVRLPPGFKVGHHEHTLVDTRFTPAVTQEKIHYQRTEIVQQAISRDIHIHHYHTTVQPIHVVEILPAKHYRLDEKTGQKTLIPAPEGWVMPPHLQPYSPDLSGVTGLTRHYLVNEEHPNGVAEGPPLHHKGDVKDLRREMYPTTSR